MLRNITAIVVLLACCVIPAVEPQQKNFDGRISIDYEFQFTEEGQQPALVKMTLSGRPGKTVRTTVDGLEGCQLEIETELLPGPGSVSKTSLKLIGNTGADHDIRFRPQLTAIEGADAKLEIGPYKLRVKVSRIE